MILVFKERRAMKYLPIIFILIAITLISVGVFFLSLPIGFIVTGIMVALLAYMIAPKGN